MAEETNKRWWTMWILLGAAIAIVALQYSVCGEAAPETIAYSELVEQIERGEIAEVEIRDTEIRAKRRDGETRVAERLPAVEQPELVDLLRKHGVKVSGKSAERSWLANVFAVWILPLGMIALLYILLFRRADRGGPLTFGRAHAKIYDRSLSEKVTFDDVAGIDEVVAELTEVVDFLKHPGKYRALGARIPKGVLLVGPPGTGKTLVAKAIAGEAEVPFFSISGSEFVEMFVGVGAARMRSLFEQAKERAPCIVFLDELDAIGKSRGGLGAMATHDEREQTLNQLLVEMDGFEPGVGVVIVAATNRPEVLDPALVRAGRFDRQVLVDRPDVGGREAILEVHARRIKRAEGVDLAVIARRTPGMVGADLANIVNEAALAAARRGSTEVDNRDFEEAIDRVQLGLKKRGRVMRESEKRRIAVHEAGHALVALSVEHADPVHRVTIVPRSIGALGATLQLPTEERYLMTRDELTDQLCVMLGGRAAEQVVFGEVSTGAENDLERATELARQMICRFGMSDELGARSLGRPGARFLETALQLEVGRDFSEDTARRIDAEIDALLTGQLDRACDILSSRRAALDGIRDRLLEAETIDAAILAEIIERTDGTPAADRPQGFRDRPAHPPGHPQLWWNGECIASREEAPMLCKDIMRRPVTCARRGETVQSAAGKMRDCRIGFLPVCDDHDRVVGVLTDRDIAVRMCAAGELPAKTPVEAIMTIEVVSCSANADVREAERLMARERKSRILVIADDGTPEGVISLSDLAGRPEADAASLLRLVAGREVLDQRGVTQPRS